MNRVETNFSDGEIRTNWISSSCDPLWNLEDYVYIREEAFVLCSCCREREFLRNSRWRKNSLKRLFAASISGQSTRKTVKTGKARCCEASSRCSDWRENYATGRRRSFSGRRTDSRRPSSAFAILPIQSATKLISQARKLPRSVARCIRCLEAAPGLATRFLLPFNNARLHARINQAAFHRELPAVQYPEIRDLFFLPPVFLRYEVAKNTQNRSGNFAPQINSR